MKRNKRLIIIIIALLMGLIVSILLVRQKQEIRKQAGGLTGGFTFTPLQYDQVNNILKTMLVVNTNLNGFDITIPVDCSNITKVMVSNGSFEYILGETMINCVDTSDQTGIRIIAVSPDKQAVTGMAAVLTFFIRGYPSGEINLTGDGGGLVIPHSYQSIPALTHTFQRPVASATPVLTVTPAPEGQGPEVPPPYLVEPTVTPTPAANFYCWCDGDCQTGSNVKCYWTATGNRTIGCSSYNKCGELTVPLDTPTPTPEGASLPVACWCDRDCLTDASLRAICRYTKEESLTFGCNDGYKCHERIGY